MKAKKNSKPIILTCTQPNSQFHLGNYLGALKNWVQLQENYHCYYGLADMHVLTMPYKPNNLKNNILKCTAQYMAFGLDPKKCNFFVQSHIHGHTELAWILGCLTSIGELQRMTQYKQKLSLKNINNRAGLLYYPILQAADILLYNTDFVPVGEDQKQHIELTRNLASRFNSIYSKNLLKTPNALIPKIGARIMGLQNPDKKMSKSDENQNNSLFFLDSADIIYKKIMRSVTDKGTEIVIRKDKAGISNLLKILSILEESNILLLENEFLGKKYVDLKKRVADVIIATFKPFQERYWEIIKDITYIQEVLRKGNQIAQQQAEKTLYKIYQKVGYLEKTKCKK